MKSAARIVTEEFCHISSVVTSACNRDRGHSDWQMDKIISSKNEALPREVSELLSFIKGLVWKLAK